MSVLSSFEEYPAVRAIKLPSRTRELGIWAAMRFRQ